MSLFDQIDLLQTVEALSCLEIDLDRKLQHHVVEIPNGFHYSRFFGGSEAASGWKV